MFLVILLLIIIFYSWYRIFINKNTNSVTCLVGKTAVVTGGTSGLGYSTCLLLASRGCKVILAGRTNGEKSRDEMIRKTGNPNIIYKYLDLSSLQNVREFAKDIINTEEKIDILINNAGISVSKEKTTRDGLNTVMQVNYFGAFLLTHLLHKLLKTSSRARIIFLGSSTIYFHQLTVDNLNKWNFEDNVFLNTTKSYANSKLCNVLAAQEFAKKLRKHRILVYSVDPGCVRTSIYVKVNDVLQSSIWKYAANIFIFLFGLDSLSASRTILHLATSEDIINEENTHYYFLRPFPKPLKLKNRQFCENIWKKSEELVMLEKEEKLCT